MGTATGMTAAAMKAIAEGTVIDADVVGTDLILTTRGGTKINAGHVKGTPGAPGGTDAAFQEWIENEGSNTFAALGKIFTPTHRAVGLKSNMVVVGSTSSTTVNGVVPWCNEVASVLGLTLRNFSIANTTFNGTNSFLTQLQAAAASTAFTNDNVAVVFITDASKSIRTWTDTGTADFIDDAVVAAYSYAKTTFVNARIICIPALWPANPAANMAGYQNVWPYALTQTIETIKFISIEQNVEFVDYSWTWLTGWPGYMQSGTIGHPTAGGEKIIAGWVLRHIRGNSTRADSPWTNVVHLEGSTASTAVNAPRFRARREGWTVHYKGSLTTTAGSAGNQVLVQFPIGFRPPISAEIQFRDMADVVEAFTGQIYLDGNVVISNIFPNKNYITSGSFTMH